jgi:hypothetical protein
MNAKDNPYQKIAEEFLKDKSNFFLPRLWNVVRWLQAERDLEGKDEFSIPIYRFKKQKIDLDEARKIITQLEDRGFLTTFKKLGGTPPGPPMQASVGVNLSEDKLIFSDPNTKLTLLHPFKYLYELLYDKYSKTDGKQIDTTKLEEKAEVIISSFSQHNLPFVLGVFTGILDSIEFTPPGGKAKYQLQSPSGGGLLTAERQLLRKLESFKLFEKSQENGISGTSSIINWNLLLIKECINKLNQKLTLRNSRQNQSYFVNQEIEKTTDNKQLNLISSKKSDYSESESYICAHLTLDISKTTLKFKEKPEIDISPDNKEIKMLTFLFKNKGKLVTYKMIAKELNINSYRDEFDDKDLARNIQDVKKQLTKILKKTGMNSKDIKEYILYKKNRGYKMNC